jgi:hypothetical protein
MDFFRLMANRRLIAADETGVIFKWPDAIAGLREMRRVMKSGGRIALCFTPYSVPSTEGLAEAPNAAGFTKPCVTDVPVRRPRAARGPAGASNRQGADALRDATLAVATRSC